MSDPGPRFYAWCDEASRVDALAAALSALALPGGYLHARMECDVERDVSSTEEAIAMVRAHYPYEGVADVGCSTVLPTSRRFALPGQRGPDALAMRSILVGLKCFTEAYERRWSLCGPHEPQGPLEMYPDNAMHFFGFITELPWGRGPRSFEVEAELAWHILQIDLEDFLLRLCEPDGSGRVRTGGCTNAWFWHAPVTTCATYNADAREIARDLAVSWVHLHDQDAMSRIAGIPLDLLRARVEAAPRGARVAIASSLSRLARRGVCARGWSLSRETVLKALAAPPSALLDALEASARPDDAWRAAAPRAAEILEWTRRLAEAGDGPPTWPVDIDTYRHFRFLKKHPPFLVRRLASGGVVLATHPYCSLWPLWAGALDALGLMC
ncbi:hypothetical protein [Sorangium cellulosum]|uniref:Uncharacterized protein n=1 Tax=Sorangium cellulosum TaxID=56 RepID=A0A150PXV4_SORCE|nr:hypothetical protein [Sorangium cellulosum]KYF60522.1 hypothetical protein BE15_33395 [Sorangium cellulosum]